MAKSVYWMLCLLLTLQAMGCDSADTAETNSQSKSTGQPLKIAVTSTPLLDMAVATAGTHGIVKLCVPEGESSLSWNPTADAVSQLQSSDLILISGAGYEPWRSRVSLPDSRTVDTAAGYYDQFVRIPDAVTHQHGPDGSHSHPGTVWPTWLDPQLAVAQLDRVTAELAKRDSDHADQYRQNALPLKQALEQLDRRLSQKAADCSELSFRFVGDGPYYQYLTRRFDRPLAYLHWNPAEDRDLTQAEVEEFQKIVEGDEPVIFLIRAQAAEDRRILATNGTAAVVSVDLIDEITDTPGSLPDRIESNINNLAAAIRITESPAK